MKNLSLAQKISGIVLVMISIMVGIIIMVFTNQSQVNTEYQKIAEVNLRKAKILGDILYNFKEIRIQVRSLGMSGLTSEERSKYVEGTKEQVKKTQEALAEYEKYPLDAKEKDKLTEVKKRMDSFFEMGQRLLTFEADKRQGFQESMVNIFRKECVDRAKIVEESLNDLTTYQVEVADHNVSTAKSLSSYGRTLGITLLVIGSCLGLVFGLSFAISLSRAFLRAVEQLKSGASQVDTVSESLAGTSTQLATSSQQQASSVEEISSSLEEISGMVSASVKSSKDSVEVTKKMSTLVEEGASDVSSLQRAVNQIAESNQRVGNLVKMIEEIGAKTKLIDDIVFQTRILSFNASVEAERAGEHGRGFAIVAQEVGNLAQMSGKSATEISQIVKNSIEEAHQVVEQSRQNTSEGVRLSTETAAKFTSILESAKEILQSSQSILRASEEQNAGIQQINHAIQLINQSTQENAASAEQSSLGSKQLKSESESLLSLVQQIEEMVKGALKRQQETERQFQDRSDLKSASLSSALKKAA